MRASLAPSSPARRRSLLHTHSRPDGRIEQQTGEFATILRIGFIGDYECRRKVQRVQGVCAFSTHPGGMAREGCEGIGRIMDERTVEADGTSADIAFSIGAMVNDHERYAEMRQSFETFGFTEADCEFIAIDASGEDQISPYLGLNTLLGAARGTHVILCDDHTRLLEDGRPQLEACLAELDAVDPLWAVAGSVGGVGPGRHSIRITDPSGADQRIGDFPAKAMSLDERFLVVRRQTRIGFSADLDGQEFYGTDICLIGEIMGLSAYVIDFHIQCMKELAVDGALFAEEKRFREKWQRVLRSRYIQTPRRLVQIGTAGAIGYAGRPAQPTLIGRIAVGRG